MIELTYITTRTGAVLEAPIRRFRGLSTDTKPTENVPYGSEFFEMDTNKTRYFYNNAWSTDAE